MEAGMTAFLTKPIEVNRLRDTLESYGLALGADPAAANARSTQCATPVNLAKLNELTDNDAEFAYELAITFIASGEQVLNEIDAAIGATDRPALSRAAHKLKGASANIHAEPLCGLALTLETQAAHWDQPRLRELIQELKEEFHRAAEFLQQQAPLPAAQAG
jgi:HPt (histidine-containing phosphotransfer) domain-containing protein